MSAVDGLRMLLGNDAKRAKLTRAERAAVLAALIALEESPRLRRVALDLIEALLAVLSCPGIDTTNQTTGETFRTGVVRALGGDAADSVPDLYVEPQA